jgi:hypothetical protein
MQRYSASIRQGHRRRVAAASASADAENIRHIPARTAATPPFTLRRSLPLLGVRNRPLDFALPPQEAERATARVGCVTVEAMPGIRSGNRRAGTRSAHPHTIAAIIAPRRDGRTGFWGRKAERGKGRR